jgi:uncharacterized repeat protein (TIGR01451 family)
MVTIQLNLRMIKKLASQLITLLIIIAISNKSVAQNSLLVNFGTSSCSGSAEPSFSLINQPLSASPSILTNCSLVSQLPDIFAVFIAYNPKNNKMYVADIRNGVETKIWLLNMGLPANIACPSLEATPDYAYSYVSNNFEFDNNGDLWSFSNYDNATGKCNMDKFDVSAGSVINTRQVQFPPGNFPTSITSGDFTILPNGRMFATLGSFPSRLYEITNYSSTVTNATATFLTTLPQNCFGIAYLNGQLEITGSDFTGSCYYYEYDISSNVLGTAKSFQNGQLPIDNTSITPSLGVTKQLVSAVKINDNTADLTYEIYVRNLGNVALNNINVIDSLGAVFGAQNISNVTLSFVPGANEAGLILNPSYNGVTDNDLLIGDQSLINQTSVNTNYFFKLYISFRVTNLNPEKVYMNSAVGSATIGSASTLSFISVSDSSNNGTQNVVDPNNNGNAGEAGENIPTPFSFATLPLRFVSITASAIDKTSSIIKWEVATPGVIGGTFGVEYSTDGISWNTIRLINIDNANQSEYRFLHTNIPAGNLYYRIRQTDSDGDYAYSKVVLLRNKNDSNGFVIFPNPANNNITIRTLYNTPQKFEVTFYDAVGRQLTSKIIRGLTEEINTANFHKGAYLLKIANDGITTTQKVLIMHQ